MCWLCDRSHVDDFDAATDVLSALPEMARDAFDRLRVRLPSHTQPIGPTSELFTVDGKAHDAGAAVQLTAVRGDQRRISWLVEVWIYSTGPSNWAMNVKAEIDLDDHNGNDYCVLNEQQLITEPKDVIAAIRQAVDLVARYPTHDLLTSGWRPSDWDEHESD